MILTMLSIGMYRKPHRPVEGSAPTHPAVPSQGKLARYAMRGNVATVLSVKLRFLHDVTRRIKCTEALIL